MADHQRVVADAGAAAVPTSGRSRRRVDWRLVLTAIVTALLTWFAFANLGSVPIHFWFIEHHAPLIVVIVVAAALGFFLGILVMWKRGRARQKAR